MLLTSSPRFQQRKSDTPRAKNTVSARLQTSSDFRMRRGEQRGAEASKQPAPAPKLVRRGSTEADWLSSTKRCAMNLGHGRHISTTNVNDRTNSQNKTGVHREKRRGDNIHNNRCTQFSDFCFCSSPSPSNRSWESSCARACVLASTAVSLLKPMIRLRTR